MKKLDTKLQKQQQDWRKISNAARKYNKDENLKNYDREVQMHAKLQAKLQIAIQAKLHSPKRLVQFQLFEKLTRAN